jgi:uncharacterized protein (DUF433 family)
MWTSAARDEEMEMEDPDDLEMDYGINWREHIHSDPNILLGKPVVRGTRLSVELLVGLFAAGWTEEPILESYPQLTRESLRSALAYAAEFVAAEAPRAVTR